MPHSAQNRRPFRGRANLLRRDRLGLDHHKLPHRSLVEKLDPPRNLGEKRIVLARPTFSPGFTRVPRCRTMIVPPGTSCPPKALNPSRCAFESRPFREVPCPFLCAINPFPSGQLPINFKPTKICHPERSEGPHASRGVVPRQPISSSSSPPFSWEPPSWHEHARARAPPASSPFSPDASRSSPPPPPPPSSLSSGATPEP